MDPPLSIGRFARIRTWTVGGAKIWFVFAWVLTSCAVGMRPTSSPIVHDARYEIHFGDRLVGHEFVRRVEGEAFLCIEGRIRQTAPEPIDLVYDVLRVNGRLESLSVRFQLAGLEIDHEAWRRGDRLVSTVKRFDRKFQASTLLPILVDVGSPLSWLEPDLIEGSFPMWGVRPPDLQGYRLEAQSGPPSARRRFEAGGATIRAEWTEGAFWPARVDVTRPRWEDDALVRTRNDELLGSSSFAPRLEGRCPTRP